MKKVGAFLFSFSVAYIVLAIILAFFGAAIFGLVSITAAFGWPRWVVPVAVAVVAAPFAVLAVLDREGAD